MISYLFLVLSATLFSSMFIFNQKYTKNTGSAFMSVLLFAIITAIFGFIYQFILNGFRLDITPFSALCALVLACIWIICTYSGFKSLESVNVSAYSVFMMLGGMFLPSLYGVVFLNEKLTVFKLLCFILTVAAILFTIDFSQKSEKKYFI